MKTLKSKLPYIIKEAYKLSQDDTVRKGFEQAGIFDQSKCCQNLAKVVKTREAKTGHNLSASWVTILTMKNRLLIQESWEDSTNAGWLLTKRRTPHIQRERIVLLQPEKIAGLWLDLLCKSCSHWNFGKCLC